MKTFVTMVIYTCILLVKTNVPSYATVVVIRALFAIAVTFVLSNMWYMLERRVLRDRFNLLLERP